MAAICPACENVDCIHTPATICYFVGSCLSAIFGPHVLDWAWRLGPLRCTAAAQSLADTLRSIGLAHAIVMPNVTDSLIDRFLADYGAWRVVGGQAV